MNVFYRRLANLKHAPAQNSSSILDGFVCRLRLTTVLTATLCSFLLVGCGGSSSSGDPTPGDPMSGDPTPGDPTDGGTTPGGNTTTGPMIGRLNVIRANGLTDIRIFFSQYDSNLTASLDDLLSAAEQPVNTCRVSRYPSDIPTLEVAEEFFAHEPIDAGEVITLTSPAGSWLSFDREERDGDLNILDQFADVSETIPVPNGLVVDVPGATFPGFAAVAIGDVEELSGVSLLNDAQVNWDAGTEANEVELTLNYGLFDNIYCRMADTGSFTLPASVQATIADVGSEYGFQLTRFATTVVRQNNSAFVVVSKSMASSGD